MLSTCRAAVPLAAWGSWRQGIPALPCLLEQHGTTLVRLLPPACKGQESECKYNMQPVCMAAMGARRTVTWSAPVCPRTVHPCPFPRPTCSLFVPLPPSTDSTTRRCSHHKLHPPAFQLSTHVPGRQCGRPRPSWLRAQPPTLQWLPRCNPRGHMPAAAPPAHLGTTRSGPTTAARAPGRLPWSGRALRIPIGAAARAVAAAGGAACRPCTPVDGLPSFERVAHGCAPGGGAAAPAAGHGKGGGRRPCSGAGGGRLAGRDGGLETTHSTARPTRLLARHAANPRAAHTTAAAAPPTAAAPAPPSALGALSR